MNGSSGPTVRICGRSTSEAMKSPTTNDRGMRGDGRSITGSSY